MKGARWGESDDGEALRHFTRLRDEASFRRLYRLHTPALFAMAIRLCGAPGAGEELIQETWLRAVERHDGFDGRSRYRTWLTGILVNCHRERRRQQSLATLPLDNEPGPSAAEHQSAPGRPPGDAIDLDRALSRLPPGYREVVILHDVNGHTHREIATMLGIRPGTSKSQLNRGRARLRELLTAGPEPASPTAEPERGGAP